MKGKNIYIRSFFIVLFHICIICSCSKSIDYIKVTDIDDCYIYNNHTYFYIKQKIEWNGAHTSCESAGGHLVIINEKKENEFIKQIIDYHTWMGLFDLEHDNYWKWVDDSFLLWSDWGKNQPDNHGIENYAHFNSDMNYSWNNMYRMNKLYFVCEIDRKITDVSELKEFKTAILNALLIYKKENTINPYKNIKGCYQYNGHTYFYIHTKTDWKKAKAACKNSGGHLLILEDEAENNFIKKFVEPWTWIGLTDEVTESIWTWVDGTPLLFEDWAKNQPDNQQELEHYAHYHFYTEYYNWNDLAYTNDLKFICEYDFEITAIEEIVAYQNKLKKNLSILLED